MDVGGEHVLRVVGILPDAVDVPGGCAAGIFKHVVAELRLRATRQALIHFHWVFLANGSHPQAANEVLAKELAPVILMEVVGIAWLFMQQVLMTAAGKARTPSTKKHLRIDARRLPLCTRLPIHVAAFSIRAEALTPAVAGTEVATHDVLEGVAEFMAESGDIVHGIGTAPEGTHLVIVAGTRGEPILLIANEKQVLVVVERKTAARTREAQHLGVHLIYFFSSVEHLLRVEGIAARCLGGVQSEAGMPEHDEVFALHAALEAPLALL